MIENHVIGFCLDDKAWDLLQCVGFVDTYVVKQHVGILPKQAYEVFQLCACILMMRTNAKAREPTQVII